MQNETIKQAGYETSTVKADPGWRAMQPVVGDDGITFSFIEMPVIAWVIETKIDDDGSCDGQDTLAFPVTPDIQPSEIIKTPEGMIIVPGECSFYNNEDLLYYIKNQDILRKNRGG